jgi:hypothetical protein
MASPGSQAWPRRRMGLSNRQGEQLYLPTLGAPELRFLAEPPPLDPNVHPPATSLPKGADPLAPDFTAAESAISAENARAASPAREIPPEPTVETREPAALPPKAAPTPILPDDTRPHTKPDDFLPFFQVPGSASRPGDVILTVPAPASAGQPAPLPPSSATYTQTPK